MKLKEVATVCKDTDDLIDVINQELKEVETLTEQTQSHVETVAPETDDHIRKLQALKEDIYGLKLKGARANQEIERDMHEDGVLDQKTEICTEAAKDYKSKELPEMVTQTRQLKDLV
jgi:outer membrane murein-binding lipoprotein Lpp